MWLVTSPATASATSASRPHGKCGTQAVVKPDASAHAAAARSSPTSVRAPPVSEMNVPMRMLGTLVRGGGPIVSEIGDRAVLAVLEHLHERVPQALRRPCQIGDELFGGVSRRIDEIGDRLDR